MTIYTIQGGPNPAIGKNAETVVVNCPTIFEDADGNFWPRMLWIDTETGVAITALQTPSGETAIDWDSNSMIECRVELKTPIRVFQQVEPDGPFK